MIAAKTDLKIVNRTILWLLITLLFYTIIRIEFLFWNWASWYQNISMKSIMEAFLSGLRFDISSLTWLSSVVLLSALLPWPSVNLNLKEMTLKSVFIIIHIPFLLINMIDLEFIHFSGRRMSISSFYLLSESQGKFLNLFISYWLIISMNLLMLYLYFRLIYYGKLFINSKTNLLAQNEPALLDSWFKKWYCRIPLTLVLVIIYVILARGGFQPKPLEMAHALSLSPDHRLSSLALNSSFTTIHSLQKKSLKPVHFFESKEEYEHLLNSSVPGVTIDPWTKKPKNVVLIILESFGLEYTSLDHEKQFSFTPFLDSLKSDSLCFENAFANGRRSIEALPSLLAGIPALMDEPFLTSPFQSNFIPQIGKNLAEKNIQSFFFHGGNNGTMFFQEFTQRLGFTHYYGKNEYPDAEKDDDGTWGIWDGPFFSFTVKELSKQKSPFFATLFSLSSHHPFQVPNEFANKLPIGPLSIHQSIAYTDLMLSYFFKEASKTEWYSDTLFIITADHTSKSYLQEYQSPLGGFRIPLLLYFPGSDFSKEKDKIDTKEPVQHIDIHSTLVDIFSISNENNSKLSRSLFKTGPRKVALYLNGQQILVDKSNVLIEPVEGDPHDPMNPLTSSWRAHRQYYINSLLENQL